MNLRVLSEKRKARISEITARPLDTHDEVPEGTARLNGQFDSREAWLRALVCELRPWFAEHGHRIPPLQITIGFPSRRALAPKRRSVGECWPSEMSSAKRTEIFISPLLDDEVVIAGTVTHELIHAVLPEAGHRAAFSQLGKALNLEGKPTQMGAGPLFRGAVKPILDKLGPIPHARLIVKDRTSSGGSGTSAARQTVRNIKVQCAECGYVCRTTRKWLDLAGPPWCPQHRHAMQEVRP